MGVERYRKLVGTVMQDDQMFAGSIADNISFFDPGATPEAIERVASLYRDLQPEPPIIRTDIPSAEMMFVVGRNRMREVHPVPDATIASIKEDIEWLKRQTS